MPLKNVRYRVKTTKGGKKIRLAFRGKKVVEAKNLKTGKTHTPSEFEEDKKRRKKKAKPTRRFREADFAEGGFINDESGEATRRERKRLGIPAPKKTKHRKQRRQTK